MTKKQLLFHLLATKDMPAYPLVANNAGVGYTDYLTGAHDQVFAQDPATGKNYVYTPARQRQCAIGYHAECTDKTVESCGCICHDLLKLLEEKP